MYKIASLLFLILISSMSVNSVFAQEISGQKISITTDNTAYEEGDVITVTGSIEKIIPGTPIILQLFIERTQVDVAQIDVSSQGDFSTTFVASGPLWSNDGDVNFNIGLRDFWIIKTASHMYSAPRLLQVDTTYPKIQQQKETSPTPY